MEQEHDHKREPNRRCSSIDRQQQPRQPAQHHEHTRRREEIARHEVGPVPHHLRLGGECCMLVPWRKPVNLRPRIFERCCVCFVGLSGTSATKHLSGLPNIQSAQLHCVDWANFAGQLLPNGENARQHLGLGLARWWKWQVITGHRPSREDLLRESHDRGTDCSGRADNVLDSSRADQMEGVAAVIGFQLN